MPLGSFMAQRKSPRPKGEKPPREKPVKPELPAAPAAPMMEDRNTDSLKLHILLFGRTLSGMQEFLCSVSENMSSALHQEGLTYYTAQWDAIGDIVDRKKKLERFFWEYSKQDWVCPDEEETSKEYTFSISPSGSQDKTVDLVFHCCVYHGGASMPADQADGIWYLADGPVLDETVGYDPYRAFLKDAIGSLKAPAEGAGKPVCLLLSHIEKDGHFGGPGEQRLLSEQLHQTLVSRCRELFPCGGDPAVAVIPVQVYGGLEYTGTDTRCNPVLRLSQSGFYQSYIPENCQLPGLFTIGQISDIQETDFFANSPCGGMKKVIRRCYARFTGDLEWKPDRLREVEQT